MKKITLVLIIAVFVLAPAMAAAVDEKDFEVKTTRDLISLCTAPPDDPLYTPAVNFCHGYLVGAYDYYRVVAAGPEGFQLVCMSEPKPSRNEAFAMFIDWANNHPQYMNEPPVETQFRFLVETWPCD